jgi:hypothetical protein
MIQTQKLSFYKFYGTCDMPDGMKRIMRVIVEYCHRYDYAYLSVHKLRKLARVTSGKWFYKYLDRLVSLGYLKVDGDGDTNHYYPKRPRARLCDDALTRESKSRKVLDSCVDVTESTTPTLTTQDPAPSLKEKEEKRYQELQSAIPQQFNLREFIFSKELENRLRKLFPMRKYQIKDCIFRFWHKMSKNTVKYCTSSGYAWIAVTLWTKKWHWNLEDAKERRESYGYWTRGEGYDELNKIWEKCGRKAGSSFRQ